MEILKTEDGRIYAKGKLGEDDVNLINLMMWDGASSLDRLAAVREMVLFAYRSPEKRENALRFDRTIVAFGKRER
jgi:hypothetical protein